MESWIALRFKRLGAVWVPMSDGRGNYKFHSPSIVLRQVKELALMVSRGQRYFVTRAGKIPTRIVEMDLGPEI